MQKIKMLMLCSFLIITGLLLGCASGGQSAQLKQDNVAVPPAQTKQDNTTAPTVKNSVAVFETSMGNFKIELYEDKAPVTTKNFRLIVK